VRSIAPVVVSSIRHTVRLLGPITTANEPSRVPPESVVSEV